MNLITYRVSAGTHISRASKDAVLLAKASKSRVRFAFNEVVLEATPKKSRFTLEWEYELITGQKHEKYRQSRRFKDYTLHRRKHSQTERRTNER